MMMLVIAATPVPYWLTAAMCHQAWLPFWSRMTLALVGVAERMRTLPFAAVNTYSVIGAALAAGASHRTLAPLSAGTAVAKMGGAGAPTTIAVLRADAGPVPY